MSADTSLAHSATRRGTTRPRDTPTHTGIIDFVREIALIVAAILAYFGVRGLTEGNVPAAVRHGHEILRFESFLRIDIEHRIQSFIVPHHWLVTLANWIYIWGHWPVLIAVLIWLHHRAPDGYSVVRNALFISGAIGLVIFAMYPVAPPRLLDVGLQDTVTEFSTSYRALQPPALVNKYAAMPSLHLGWNLLIGIALIRFGGRRPLKLLGVLSPILMAAAVVVTANHYLLDVFVGAAVALVGLALSLALSSRRGGSGEASLDRDG